MNWIPIVFSCLLFVVGSLLGLSDDEAYYWVLAQKPALAYAFHPPAVAWVIALFSKMGTSPAWVRLPSALTGGLLLALGLNWLNRVGLDQSKRSRAAGVMLSFFGFFSLAWMMVPDIPLFLGWTALFFFTWKICNKKDFHKDSQTVIPYLGLSLSAATVLLSKYSGVLAIFSSFISILFWATKEKKRKAVAFLAFGTMVALIPILVWNSEHEWVSILYQIRDRHSGEEISWIRYGRFWLAEVLLAGPILVGFTCFTVVRVLLSWRKTENAIRFVMVWLLPGALVFCTQPLFSDFKLHWAFVVWWPAVLALAWKSQNEKDWKWIRWQAYYGIALGLLVWICCFFPIGSQLLHHYKGEKFDPRLDVTNDLYGWKDLKSFFATQLDENARRLPVVASRYQTASQAAFSLAGVNHVTMLPRDYRERDEWPELGVSDGWGPNWPRLLTPVLFVADNRYDAPPEYKGATCVKLKRLEARRQGLLIKWIDVWRCDPEKSINR